MRLLFLRDFQGKETGERFYLAGEEGEIENEGMAQLLVKNNVAVSAIELNIDPEPVQEEKPKGRKK